jgi:hypothetical protein
MWIADLRCYRISTQLEIGLFVLVRLVCVCEYLGRREGAKGGGEGEHGDRKNVPQVFVLGHGLLHAGFNLMEGSFVGGGEGGAVFIAGLFGLVVVRCSEVLVWGYGKGIRTHLAQASSSCAGFFQSAIVGLVLGVRVGL